MTVGSLRAVPALALLLTGCGLPLSTFHGPVPVPVETSRVGVGVGPVFLERPDEYETAFDKFMMGLYAGARIGVSERVEAGASIGMWNGISGDLKYALIRGPVHVSANLAVSTNPLLPTLTGVHPALLVGTERIYGGGKVMLYPYGEYGGAMSVLFAGASIGGATRIVPEVGVWRDPDEARDVWLAGVKVQRSVATGVLSARDLLSALTELLLW